MAVSDTVYLRIARRLDPIAVVSGQMVAWLIIPMVLALSFEVVSRYAFNMPTLWAYDMTFMMYGTYFMLGAAFTLQRKGHVRTDSFYGEWSVRRQAVVDMSCYLLMFLPFVLVLIFTGWGYFLKSFLTDERFVTSPWMPVAWPFKGVMPLTGVLLLIQGVAEFFKSLHAFKTGEWPDQKSPELETVIT